MSIFILSESAKVLFEDAFFPVSIPNISGATIRNNFHANVSCFMRAVFCSCMYTKTAWSRSHLFKETT